MYKTMKPDRNYKPEFESLKELLIDMAQERSVDILLNLVVERMSARPHVALTRIWLIREGDICAQCTMINNCRDRKRCLHLVAGAGLSQSTQKHDWSDLHGYGKRIPLQYSCIGNTALTGKAPSTDEIQEDPHWKQRHTWASGENILGFGAQPLVCNGDVSGVIAVYSRIESVRVREGRFWLKMIANLTASTIVNARAFSEIDRLKSQLELENAYLRQEIEHTQVFGDIIGKSPQLITIQKQVELVAPTDASVFICGESGTGKELVAREIHKRSKRCNRPMIKVNCASIPGELYESEFFGHVKGAFTGAVQNRAGRFQAADGGTLFLDEIGELPVPLQSKLLRVLQEGAYERIGEDKTRHVNVRIIAATNRDIKKAIEEGLFRQDLYYRLNVFPIDVAPLKNRKEDIGLLAYHFLQNISSDMSIPVPELTSSNLKELSDYNWPGNVRELRNVIERSVITAQGGRLQFDLVNPSERNYITGEDKKYHTREKHVMTDREITRMIIKNTQQALQNCHGKIYGKDGAARLLGVAPTTLSSRIKKHNLNSQKTHLKWKREND